MAFGSFYRSQKTSDCDRNTWWFKNFWCSCIWGRTLWQYSPLWIGPLVPLQGKHAFHLHFRAQLLEQFSPKGGSQAAPPKKPTLTKWKHWSHLFQNSYALNQNSIIDRASESLWKLPFHAVAVDLCSFFPFLIFFFNSPADSSMYYPISAYFSSLPVSLSALLGTLVLPLLLPSVSSSFLFLSSGTTSPFWKFFYFLFLPPCPSLLPHDGVQPFSSGILCWTFFFPSSILSSSLAWIPSWFPAASLALRRFFPCGSSHETLDT